MVRGDRFLLIMLTELFIKFTKCEHISGVFTGQSRFGALSGPKTSLNNQYSR